MVNWVSNSRAAVLTLGIAACLLLDGCVKTYGGGGGGGGGGATVSLSPGSLTFATETVGTPSAPKSVTLTNSGTAILYITSITITGANSSDFAETNTCGGSVNANGNCTISVTFTPSASGSRVAAVSITDGATGSPQTVSLTGTGAAGTPSASLSPTSLTFASQTVGSSSAAQTVTLSNAGTATLSNIVITFTGANIGDFAQTNTSTCGSTLASAQLCDINVTFTPTAAGTRTATLTVTDNATPSTQTVSLTGTGTSATTVANVTPSSLVFGNVTVNTTSAAQTVTVSNGGTTTFTVNTVTTAAPFAVSGFSPALPATLSANQSLTFQVTFAPTAAVTSNGSVTIAYDVASGLANSVVSTSGTGVSGGGGGSTACGGGGAPTITTLALPQATASKNYIAFLQASGGTGTCTWSLTAGPLPGSLTLDSSGVIFGTAPSTTGTSSSFTVQVKDSAGMMASEALTIKTDGDTGAVCEDVYIDTGTGDNPPATPVPVTIDGILNGSHIVPLNDLGTKGLTYNGQTGGLYPGGSNMRPAAYETAGLGIASSIQPLNANGNPDPVNGKYVLVTIGMSNVNIESARFVSDVSTDTSLNSHLAVVNGAENGQDAQHLQSPTAQYWTDVKTKLSQATSTGNTGCGSSGCSANQVVIAWVKEALAGQRGGASNFPGDANVLAGELKIIAQNLKINFPNIKLAYFSSRIYAGYASNVHLLNPEYVAYESGFAVKFAVADSINGNLPTNPSPPWFAWGPYLWANGMIPRSDGTVWTCQNLQGDGTHPSSTPPSGQPAPDPGAEKVSQMLLKFFKTDSTTKPWFCATGACP